jgi:Flp pilus assembly protein CpaB
MSAGDPLRWSTFEAKQSSKVLFLKVDAGAGRQLSEDELEERFVADALLTPSWVPASDRGRVSSRRVLVPFLKGDPLLWTHLDAEPKK